MFTLATVKTVPENPETAAAHILDAVIIAGKTILTRRELPPLWRDPFRAFETDDLMLDTPPFEQARRTIRNFGHHVDWLGRIE